MLQRVYLTSTNAQQTLLSYFQTVSKQVSKQVRRFLVGALNVQSQGATAELTKHKRFQQSFELSEGDVR